MFFDIFIILIYYWRKAINSSGLVLPVTFSWILEFKKKIHIFLIVGDCRWRLRRPWLEVTQRKNIDSTHSMSLIPQIRDSWTAPGPNRSEVFEILVVLVQPKISFFVGSGLVLVRVGPRIWGSVRTGPIFELLVRVWPNFQKPFRPWSELVQDF